MAKRLARLGLNSAWACQREVVVLDTGGSKWTGSLPLSIQGVLRVAYTNDWPSAQQVSYDGGGNMKKDYRWVER